MLELQPIDWEEACLFIGERHRHHSPPQGWKFGIAANNGEKIVGVVTVGRPVARHLQDGWTLEVTRCCTDGTKHACSMLYAAAWRAAKAMGYKRLLTYILDTETGVSLKAAGWVNVSELLGEKSRGGSWSKPSRPRVDKHPTQMKIRWESVVPPELAIQNLQGVAND